MANDSFKVKKGLNIEPNSTPNLSADGDIGFNSTDSNLELYTGGSVKKVITNSQTQTLTNKTLTAPTIDVMTLDGQASAPSNPSAGNYKVYVDDTTSKLQILDSTGTVTTVGTSAGGINYITNGDAESGTTGWATYADAAGTSPVDGTGGSAQANLWTRTTTTPLRGIGSFLWSKTGSADRQGQGVAYNFSIASADQGKVMQITMDYSVVSGTYATGDIAVYIVHDPNGTPKVIQPSGYQIENVGVASVARLTFQTEVSAQLDYNLCFHQATATTQNYDLEFDTITLGPQVVPLGAPVTDPVTFTPTGSWVTNTTYTGNWRRVGKFGFYDINIALAGAPTAASLTVNLPSGHVIDTAAMASSGVELTQLPGSSGGISDAGARVSSVMAYYNSTTSVVVIADNSTTAPATVNATTPITFANTDSINIKFSVPIVGWSSSTVVSSSADTRVVTAIAGSPSTGSHTSETIISWTKTYDTHGAFGTTTFTAPMPGYYRFSLGVLTSSFASSTTGANQLYYKINGGTSVRCGWVTNSGGTTNFWVGGSGEVYLSAGQTLAFYSQSTSSCSITSGELSINLLQGPSQIAASEVVAARYTSTSGNTLTTTPTIQDFATKTYDTHNAVTTGASWRFTAPAPGYYQVMVASTTAATTTVLGVIFELFKNGVLYSQIARNDKDSTTSSRVIVGGSDTIYLLAGEYIDIRDYVGTSTLAISTTAGQNFIAVNRLGGVM